jgi:flavodoxin
MKKATALLLSVTMILSLTACGGTTKSTAEETADTAAQENNAEVVTEQTETDMADDAESPEADTEAGEIAAEEEASQDAAAGKTLVVYYSATNHTETVANYIAGAADADVFELVPVDEYSSDDLDWTDDDSRVVFEYENPEERDVELVETEVPDWDSYDTVFIGYPIWWGIAAWPTDGFVKANDFTGKTVIPFCTSSSSGLGESGSLLAEEAGTGDWQEGMRFSSGASESDVTQWVESLGF